MKKLLLLLLCVPLIGFGQEKILINQLTNKLQAEAELPMVYLESLPLIKYKGELLEIEINKISQNPFQPRHQFDISKLDELAHSIKKLGLIGHFLLFFLTVDLDYGYHYY